MTLWTAPGSSTTALVPLRLTVPIIMCQRPYLPAERTAMEFGILASTLTSQYVVVHAFVHFTDARVAQPNVTEPEPVGVAFA